MKSESKAWTVSGWAKLRKIWVYMTIGGTEWRWSHGPVLIP